MTMIDAVMLSSLARGLTGASAAGDSAATQGAAAAGVVGQPSFLDVMKDTATSLFQDIRGAETMSAEGLSGKANTRAVVDSVMTADRELQTAIAIRDKVVSAYLDITKMTI